MRKTKKVDCIHCGNEKEYLEDIICNKCGETCKIYLTMDFKSYNYEGLRAKVRAGFGSQFDGSIMKFDLCDSCLAELVASFKIPIQDFEYDLWAGKEIDDKSV